MQKIETISRASSEELAWLAGFFDGEGFIYMGLPNRGTFCNVWRARCGMPNTKPECIEKATDILSRCNIKFYIALESPRKIIHNKTLRVDITSHTQCKKFIELIFVYLSNKKDLAIQFLEFEKRLESLNNMRKSKNGIHKAEDDILLAMWNRMKELIHWIPGLEKYSRQSNKPVYLKKPSETTKPTIIYND
jgi:hypothetical protein